ncbi:MAG: VCBS repeat-containing protein [Planctomycetes bacterium]|nr:VCBS repeat-containing protein [Planctomycetota bacterium]
MSPSPVARFSRRWGLICGGIALATGLLAWAWNQGAFATVPAGKLVTDARRSLQRGRYDEAERLARRIPKSEKLFGQAQLIAGEAAMRAGRTADALKYYGAVNRDGSMTAVTAAFAIAELLRDAGKLSAAEREYKYVLRFQPDNLATHERMAFLLGVTGRRWESLPHFLFLAKSGNSTVEELALLGDLDRPVEQPEFLQKCARTEADDVLVRLGMAAQAVTDGRTVDAVRLLRSVIDQSPDLITARVMLGELQIDANSQTFVDWNSHLPRAANDFAETWFVRGLWARHQGDLPVAARCFWETVRRDPTHRRGNYQLGQVLVSLGDPAAPAFAERANQLYELTRQLDQVLKSQGQDELACQRVTEILESTGRIWEACSWADAALKANPSADWARSTARKLAVQLSDDLPRTINSANLSMTYNLSSFPDHQRLLQQVGARDSHLHHPRKSRIRFVEVQAVGLEFVYYNSHDPSKRGARMFEQTGGGVAAVDFDGDGFPDLYFTQGCLWKLDSKSPEPPGATTDRLFQNRGTAFVDVTRQAGFVDAGFGQGCAAGDFDNDGFPDLLVANIGRNQLFRNNGDGTFTDVTDATGIVELDWTSSCVIVDLNADGFPDLFAVNYLTGPDVFEAICHHRACSPKGFEGVPDCLYINRGDGTFEKMPDATPKLDSKGLGLVAFDQRIHGRPNLFISNDQVPDFFLRNSPASNPFRIHLENEGFIRGLAFTQDGLALASMGIAADDVNGDGRLDFYVTTFKNEPKLLFLQDASGNFLDSTRQSGLAAPGLAFVGWGAQFLDADLDGDPDLVVTNGHVDDYRDVGEGYHMRPQLFHNKGGGRFEEFLAPEAGDYFSRQFLGRGLARLDWNQDGRMDFVVSNIGTQASLVTNDSEQTGRFLNVKLHATTTARDAIGAVVEVVTPRRRLSRQLVAGDGYMASNERFLQFGLDDCASAETVRVTWPSGATATLGNVPADSTLILIEGRRRGILRHAGVPGELDVTPGPPAQ